MEQKHWLFWDGECGLCEWCARWVQRRDRHHRFQVVPYQHAPSPPMTESLRAACQQSVHVLQADGTLLSGGRAVLFVLREVGFRWARWLEHQPLVYVVEAVYRWVARRRRCLR